MNAAGPPAPKCAACGKEGNSLKACTACKLVKYCNTACQKAHRPKHKKECRKRAAEIYDEALFKEHPREDCPICSLPLPRLDQATYKSCCGKIVCNGCMAAMGKTDYTCAFCRMPPPKSQGEDVARIKKRIASNDGTAFDVLGIWYSRGSRGLRKDVHKALKLWRRSVELGCAGANYNIGVAYNFGQGVGANRKKARHHYELAVMSGNLEARHNLGVLEHQAGNIDRSFKHLCDFGEGRS